MSNLVSDPMSNLVSAPTGAPIRKIMIAFIAAIVLKVINTVLPAVFPFLLTSPIYAPIYMEFLTWAPLIAAYAGYNAKEWPSSIPPQGEQPNLYGRAVPKP